MRLVLVFGSLCTLLILGCASPRPSRDAATLEQRDHLQGIAYARTLESVSQGLFQRAEQLWDAQDCGSPPALNVLILSSGGFWGAFGAGFIAGWAERERDPMPDFDLVSGISTGALIAPFALRLQARDPQRVETLYRSSAHDWLRKPWYGIWPWRQAIFDHRGLSQAMSSVFDADMVSRLAEIHLQHRQLLVATADLDTGHQVLWPLQQKSAQGMNATSLQDILRAAIAIPGILEPVSLDDGLHVDSATVETLMVGTEPWVFKQFIRLWREAYPQRPVPSLRIWIVVNGKQRIERRSTRPYWPDIVRRSVAAVGKSGLNNGLRSLSLTGELLQERYGVDFQVQWICVPEDFVLPAHIDDFSHELTDILANLGRRIASAPKIPWREVAPGVVDLELPPLSIVDDSPEEGE